MTDPQTEAQGLIEILKARGITHRKIASKCFTTEGSVSSWSLGKRQPYEIYLEHLRQYEIETRPKAKVS